MEPKMVPPYPPSVFFVNPGLTSGDARAKRGGYLVVCPAQVYEDKVPSGLLAMLDPVEEVRSGDAWNVLVPCLGIRGVPGSLWSA